MTRYSPHGKRVYAPGETRTKITQLKSLARWDDFCGLPEDLLGTLGLGKFADFSRLDLGRRSR